MEHHPTTFYPILLKADTYDPQRDRPPTSPPPESDDADARDDQKPDS